jgi:hypothetical protein
LKILFASEDCFREGVTGTHILEALKLERNEVTTLVNLLNKLSISVATYRSFSLQVAAEAGTVPCVRLEDFIA